MSETSDLPPWIEIQHPTLTQRAGKLLWAQQQPEVSGEFIWTGYINTLTPQIFLSYWELGWNWLISPWLNTLRFADEKQPGSPKEVEHLLPAERNMKNWGVLKGVLPINLHLDRSVGVVLLKVLFFWKLKNKKSNQNQKEKGKGQDSLNNVMPFYVQFCWWKLWHLKIQWFSDSQQ